MGTDSADLSTVENLLRELVDAVSTDMFGTEFWSSTLSTLLGVGVGATLTWVVTRHFQKQDFEDRYSERLDGRNLIWMDALHRCGNAILEDWQQSNSYDPTNYSPGDDVAYAFSEFSLRIRQAGLVARREDHIVLDAIESDVRETSAALLNMGRFDPELITRTRMLMDEFTRYRRGSLHPSWFTFWAQGAQMPFVPEGHDPLKSAPRTDPTARSDLSSHV